MFSDVIGIFFTLWKRKICLALGEQLAQPEAGPLEKRMGKMT
jgi:hypothetical protein